MTVFTTAYDLEWKPAGSWTAVADNSVVSITGNLETAQADGGVGFGTTSHAKASVTVLRTAVAGITLSRLPVRFTYTVGASSELAFVGIARSWSGDRYTITLECTGLLEDMSERTKDIYTALRYRRAPMTKTTASSIEDPTNGSYQGGVVNELFWEAGLRPFEQAGSYASADGYYSFNQALRAPDWTWIAAENGWSAALELARAVGGKFYNGTDGAVYYRNPLSMIGSVTKTYNLASADAMDHYTGLSEEGNTDQFASTITVSYIPRSIQPTQEVISDTTLRVVAAGETVTFSLEPQWPLYSVVLDGGTLKANNIFATYYDGTLVAYGAGGMTVVTTIDGQRITLAITNGAALNFQITKIVIHGQPVAAGEAGSVTVGSGQPTKVLEDNPFIQSEAHARALATMGLSFYGQARPIRTLTGCVFDPDRTADETVNLTDSALGLSAAPHLILGISHSETGRVADYTLLDADDLPALADYWLVQAASQSGSKLVGW